MKRSKKIRIAQFGVLFTFIGLLIFTAASTAMSVVKAVLNVNEESFFPVTVDGHDYRCYRITEDDPDVHSVAIALNEDASTTTKTTLNVPSSVTHEGTTYTVKAIAKAGFRYTNFDKFVVPQTVEEIREEAFAYCFNLTSFDIPNKVSKIAPSTFLDCRALESVYYTNSSGNKTFGNSVITEIGDHAFDSCVALREFNVPRSAVYFGESCFQKCSSLVNFYFPSTIEEDEVIQNYVTIRPYAFADCSNLIFVYFETNVAEIDNYAFVDCNSSLSMKYNGTSIPTYSRTTDGSTVNQTHWRDKNIATNLTGLIPIEINHPTIHTDDDYPCLRYTIESDPVYLDSANGRRPTVQVIDQTEINNEGSYAVIYKFDTPAETVDGCFNVTTGALTIPNELNGKTVKVIRQSTFANNLAIKSVSFNPGLVQICNKAFYKCSNIESIDFSRCEKLKEISFFCFNDYSNTNSKPTSLILPEGLEYVGDYGLAGFTKVNTFSLPSSIKAIADLAFYKLGNSISTPAVDLVLPKSLEDDNAAAANFHHQKKDKWSHDDYTRWYAIGKYAFEGAKCLKTVTMESDSDHANDDNYTTSMFSNAFKDCSNMVKFTANKNLQVVGKDAFKGCSSLREIFLTTRKSSLSELTYPWCVDENDASYGGSLFTGASPDLVIYLDGPAAPGGLENYTVTTENTNDIPKDHKWNAETTNSYLNEVRITEDSNSTGSYSRTHIPTFYNVDFENGITYWDPKGKTTKTAPKEIADYNNGIISFVKQGSEYSVGRYYCDCGSGKGTDRIDLTIIPNISATLTKIGDSAFGHNNLTGANDARTKQPGLYFILPETITEIGERAFYRKTENSTGDDQKANGRFGARIITYKNSDGKYISDDGTTELSESDFNSKITTLQNQYDVDKRGYCVLPPNVTRVGKVAFYNHIFKTIRLSASITYLGHGAFYTQQGSKGVRTTSTTVTIGTNANFVTSNNGLYYIGGGNDHKMLMYQAANNSSALSLADNTKAVGFEGCANTKITSVDLRGTVQTIYGNGFARNSELTTVTGVSALRYISSMEAVIPSASWSDDGYTEIFDATAAQHTSNVDYKDKAYKERHVIESLYGGFVDCKKLETFNFNDMDEIRKIGRASFHNCSKLKYMTGTDTYTYKLYNPSTDTSTVIDGGNNISAGVLDLSGASHLRSIGKEAFFGCTELKFLHLPDNRGSATQSTMHIGFDPEAPYYSNTKGSIIDASKGIRVLVGETAAYAHHDFGKGHNAQNHYHSTCFGTSGNLIYYYVASASDIPSTDTSSIKYWTREGTGNTFILFDSAVDARDFYGV